MCDVGSLGKRIGVSVCRRLQSIINSVETSWYYSRAEKQSYFPRRRYANTPTRRHAPPARQCFLFRKREPNLHGRAFTTDYHRGTGIVDWRELLLEWSTSKIDRWKRESRDICDDQAVSRIDQHHTVSRIESSRTAKIIDSNIVTSECKFVATPDRVRNQCGQTGD